jgi:uncharacterized protein YabN with tetrapyrrole methylase and pyrophosphatase domain
LYHINAEGALRKANQKFIRRFQWLEEIVRSENKSFSELSKEELLSLWVKSKKLLKNQEKSLKND